MEFEIKLHKNSNILENNRICFNNLIKKQYAKLHYPFRCDKAAAQFLTSKEQGVKDHQTMDLLLDCPIQHTPTRLYLFLGKKLLWQPSPVLVPPNTKTTQFQSYKERKPRSIIFKCHPTWTLNYTWQDSQLNDGTFLEMFYQKTQNRRLQILKIW